MILNRAKDYYENKKERLTEPARGEYRNLSEEQKNKTREYERNRYYNMSEKEKQKLKEYKKKTTAMLKSLNLIKKIVLIVYVVIYAN